MGPGVLGTVLSSLTLGLRKWTPRVYGPNKICARPRVPRVGPTILGVGSIHVQEGHNFRHKSTYVAKGVTHGIVLFKGLR